MTVLPLIALLLVLIAATWMWRRQRVLRREAHIREFALPKGLFDRLRGHHPQLTAKDCQLVAHGLRQFFLACLKSGRQPVAMPSQAADDLWHEFIVYTRHYQDFCRHAFGRFLHHTPAIVLGPQRAGNAGLRRCWWHVCREEHIDPRKPTRLPLLFALDTKLGIAGGFRYVPDCGGPRRTDTVAGGGGSTHCATDFHSDRFDGGTDGFGDASHGGSDGDGGSSDGGGGGCSSGGGD
ncbi:hypothetical protein HLB44_03390 [Aquincola sp. S2]|uniref:Uncharacterized protein n=1 Tax=Pseudaquabacterium terrae TaxID=2732868 RepID=A0ABX2ECC1_9BURK|nr:hypothetical protein [Aquabacterium terrae]NRF66027.1 hypothetical protein [Aquabacterium terrae]